MNPGWFQFKLDEDIRAAGLLQIAQGLEEKNYSELSQRVSLAERHGDKHMEDFFTAMLKEQAEDVSQFICLATVAQNCQQDGSGDHDIDDKLTLYLEKN